MEIIKKTFEELSTQELFEIMKKRIDVFVVEQNCPYPEIDELDKTAVHMWLTEGGEILSYLRLMDKTAERPFVSIGRVLSAKRRCGYATKLLAEAINEARIRFGADKIHLEAQTYAKKLYEKQGFRQISEEFLEDGIPHVKMMLECN